MPGVGVFFAARRFHRPAITDPHRDLPYHRSNVRKGVLHYRPESESESVPDSNELPTMSHQISHVVFYLTGPRARDSRRKCLPTDFPAASAIARRKRLFRSLSIAGGGGWRLGAAGYIFVLAMKRFEVNEWIRKSCVDKRQLMRLYGISSILPDA